MLVVVGLILLPKDLLRTTIYFITGRILQHFNFGFTARYTLRLYCSIEISKTIFSKNATGARLTFVIDSGKK